MAIPSKLHEEKLPNLGPFTAWPREMATRTALESRLVPALPAPTAQLQAPHPDRGQAEHQDAGAAAFQQLWATPRGRTEGGLLPTRLGTRLFIYL